MESGNLDEYLELRRGFAEGTLRVEVQTGISRAGVFFDGSTAALLRQIDRLGSVKEAASKNGISYSKAWKLIGACEEAAGREVVTRVHGGKYGGEASLTEFGRTLVDGYDRLDRDIRKYAAERFEELRGIW